MKSQIRKRVQEVLHFFKEKHGVDYKTPKIGFFKDPEDLGMAYSNEWEIKFNTDFLKSHPDLMLSELVPHEVIHLIADTKQRPLEGYHGRTWCRFMREFGLEPKTHYEFN